MANRYSSAAPIRAAKEWWLETERRQVLPLESGAGKAPHLFRASDNGFS